MNRVSRIFTQNLLPDSQERILEDETAHYLLNVLRVKPGQRLEMVDGQGGLQPATVSQRDRRRLTLALDPIQTFDTRSPVHTTLELAMTKGERFEWALQKATELGADVIQPLVTEHSEVRLKGDRQAKKSERWKSIVVSAMEQSKRSHLPQLNDPITIDQLPALSGIGVVLAPEQAQGWPSGKPQDIRVLIGPEGGFSDREVQWALQQGYQGVGLGPRILRAETAAVAAMTLCQSHYGDFA